jgi:hypothetical protein
MRKNLVAIAFLSAFSVLTGCAASGGSGADPTTPAGQAGVELTPMAQIKAIKTDLDAQVAALMQPIDDMQSAIDALATMPKKYSLSATDLMVMAKASFDNGQVQLTLNSDIAAEAKADIQAQLEKLVSAVKSLKQTPDRVASLTGALATATAKVPVLATRVTASATATASNPFSSADAKAKAQADLKDIQQVQQDVMQSIKDVQTKITNIPTTATRALAKASASLLGSGDSVASAK